MIQVDLLAADIESVDGNGDLAALDTVSTPDLARLIGVGSPGAYGRAGKRESTTIVGRAGAGRRRIAWIEEIAGRLRHASRLPATRAIEGVDARYIVIAAQRQTILHGGWINCTARGTDSPTRRAGDVATAGRRGSPAAVACVVHRHLRIDAVVDAHVGGFTGTRAIVEGPLSLIVPTRKSSAGAIGRRNCRGAGADRSESDIAGPLPRAVYAGKRIGRWSRLRLQDSVSKDFIRQSTR